MTQAAKRPTTTTPRTRGSQPTLNEHGSGEQDRLSGQDLVSDRDRDDGNDRDERAERNSDDEQREQRARREDRADDRDGRDVRNERLERDSRDEFGDGREPRREPGGVQRTVEQATDRVRAAPSNPGDAFGGSPDMSKVLTAWFDMAGDMMKLQQQFFANILGAGNTNDRNTTKA
jgi:hypothetical protein